MELGAKNHSKYSGKLSKVVTAPVPRNEGLWIARNVTFGFYNQHLPESVDPVFGA